MLKTEKGFSAVVAADKTNTPIPSLNVDNQFPTTVKAIK